MSILSTVMAEITFFEICAALLVVGVAERAMLRYAPDTWLKATGLAA